jgi:hypothetical protein
MPPIRAPPHLRASHLMRLQTPSKRPAVAREVLSQGDDRHDAQAADGDERAFDPTGRDVNESEGLALPLEDRNSTTAVPMFAMMSSSSRSAPRATRVSDLEPVI